MQHIWYIYRKSYHIEVVSASLWYSPGKSKIKNKIKKTPIKYEATPLTEEIDHFLTQKLNFWMSKLMFIVRIIHDQSCRAKFHVVLYVYQVCSSRNSYASHVILTSIIPVWAVCIDLKHFTRHLKIMSKREGKDLANWFICQLQQVKIFNYGHVQGNDLQEIINKFLSKA